LSIESEKTGYDSFDGAADFQYPKRFVHCARGDVEAEAQAHAKGAFLGQIL